MESEIAQFVNRAENAELQIQELVKELDALAKGVAGGVIAKSSPETSISKPTNQGKFLKVLKKNNIIFIDFFP